MLRLLHFLELISRPLLSSTMVRVLVRLASVIYGFISLGEFNPLLALQKPLLILLTLYQG